MASASGVSLQVVAESPLHAVSDSSLIQHSSPHGSQIEPHKHEHHHVVSSEADLRHPHHSSHEHVTASGTIHPAWKDVCDCVQTEVEIQHPHSHASAVQKWHSAERKLAKIGYGSSHSEHDPLYLQTLHWLEATDPKHRNGSNLKPYFTHWKELQQTDADDSNFFHWLDFGEGKNVDLEKCPRKKMEAQLVHYCNAHERQFYLVEITKGVVRYRHPHPNRQLISSLATSPAVEKQGTELVEEEMGEILDSGRLGNGLIYVMDTEQRLFVNKKVRGSFHHSSFLSGGTTIAAGAIQIVNGTIVQISPQSGHYRPSDEDFVRFKNILLARGVDLEKVSFVKAGEGEG